jgi:hypothetical protein
MILTKCRPALIAFLLAASLLAALIAAPATPGSLVPITGRAPGILGEEPQNTLPSLEQFADSLKSDTPTLAGVYVPDVLALQVVQQPESNAGFVSTRANTVTQFSMASQYNTTGLLAHDYLAGVNFTRLEVGQVAALIYGNGTLKYFKISAVHRYQALSPTSAYSHFIDLASQRVLSADELFFQTYGVGNQLIFQTCISTSQVSSWGRLFVLARPVNAPVPELAAVAPLLHHILKTAGLVFSRR